MFEPMFGPQPGVFGIPAIYVVTGLGFALGIIGAVWALRLTKIEPDVHSFRSTQPGPRDHRPILIGAGVGILVTLALALLSMGLTR